MTITSGPAPRSRRLLPIISALLISAGLLTGCGRHSPDKTAAVEPAVQPFAGSTGAVTARSIGDADDGQWTMAAKNYASTRFAAAQEINAANVGK